MHGAHIARCPDCANCTPTAVCPYRTASVLHGAQLLIVHIARTATRPYGTTPALHDAHIARCPYCTGPILRPVLHGARIARGPHRRFAQFLDTMARMSATPLRQLSPTWHFLPQVPWTWSLPILHDARIARCPHCTMPALHDACIARCPHCAMRVLGADIMLSTSCPHDRHLTVCCIVPLVHAAHIALGLCPYCTVPILHNGRIARCP